ncbi:MAG: PIN domain-containing protein [Pseudomonadota bacterium]
MTKAIQAIYDTNVFVAAGFNRRSASARLIQAARDGKIRMIWCKATRAEIERILTKIPPLDWEAVADVFRHEVEAPDPDPATAAFVTDPEDRKFAALSLAAGTPIISADSDLTVHAGRLDVWSAGAFWTAYMAE